MWVVRYTTRVVFLPFQALDMSTDVSAHSHLSDMAEAASAVMGLLIGLGQRLKADIKDDNKPLQQYISEVATLLPSNVHERVLTGYGLLLWFTDKVCNQSYPHPLPYPHKCQDHNMCMGHHRLICMSSTTYFTGSRSSARTCPALRTCS